MKKISILFFLVSFLVTAGLLSSCNQQEGQQSANETGNQGSSDISSVYQSYLDLKESLANDNAEEAQKNAQQLKQEIENSGIQNKEALSDAASQIAASGDISAQREAFANLSNQFIEVVKKNPEAIDKAFIQHCAMALNNEGAYWVSDSEEIRNPYMGQKMPTCGSTKEIIE